MMYPRLKLLHKLLANDGATSKDHIPLILKLDRRDKKLLLEYIVSAESKESQVRKITSWILKELDIDDSQNPKELRKFINRIV